MRERGRSRWGGYSYNLMWGSDYPHSESTFPRTRQILADLAEENAGSEWSTYLPIANFRFGAT